MREWEEFGVGPRRRELHVTLDRTGEFVIGATAVERLGGAEAAVLLFDRANGVIGVRPVDERVENAYPLVRKANGRHRVIRAGRFCGHYGIRPERTVAFRDVVVEDGVLVLQLKRTSDVGRGATA